MEGFKTGMLEQFEKLNAKMDAFQGKRRIINDKLSQIEEDNTRMKIEMEAKD